MMLIVPLSTEYEFHKTGSDLYLFQLKEFSRILFGHYLRRAELQVEQGSVRKFSTREEAVTRNSTRTGHSPRPFSTSTTPCFKVKKRIILRVLDLKPLDFSCRAGLVPGPVLSEEVLDHKGLRLLP
ncbi:hypothetical protein B296_00014897 [Ensete ventricosum]|uniref:Uncharacterized protein n=1 Tax=Ensete ventricosum TaxID=4639 RepID=A0A426ZHT9_ENSVE|nr:hypothetical protein B296_00014897 [Ensete ventricosum]